VRAAAASPGEVLQQAFAGGGDLRNIVAREVISWCLFWKKPQYFE